MKISKVRDVKTPTRGTAKSAGLDFYVPYDFTPQKLYPGKAIKIPSGIYADIPEGTALVAFNKSSISEQHKLQVGACVGDEDYQGELHLHVFNVSTVPVWITPGMKIVQFVCLPVLYIDVDVVPFDQLYSNRTDRGNGGFGSTDKSFVGGPDSSEIDMWADGGCTSCGGLLLKSNTTKVCAHCKSLVSPNRKIAGVFWPKAFDDDFTPPTPVEISPRVTPIIFDRGPFVEVDGQKFEPVGPNSWQAFLDPQIPVVPSKAEMERFDGLTVPKNLGPQFTKNECVSCGCLSVDDVCTDCKGKVFL